MKRQSLIQGESGEKTPIPVEVRERVGALRAVGARDNPQLLAFCTSTRLDAQWVVSAGHCVSQAIDSSEEFTFFWSPDAAVETDSRWAGCTASPPEREIESWHRHPELDLALLKLKVPFPAVSPELSLVEAPIEDGTPAYIAGYGRTETLTMGDKEFLSTQIVRHEGSFLITKSDTEAGACSGDSGGPLLVQAETWRLAGVLSKGAANCRGEDFYIDLQAPRVESWLSETMRVEGN